MRPVSAGPVHSQPRARRPLRESIPSFSSFLRAVVAASPSHNSSIHGVTHWRETAAIAVRLLERVTDADSAVPLVFAAVHDALRADDLDDSAHGIRAAEFVDSLTRAGVLTLDDTQLELVVAACRYHSARTVTANPTIAVCWDADRLGLRRLGVTLDPELLSLEASRTLPAGGTPLAWSGVYARYLRLEPGPD